MVPFKKSKPFKRAGIRSGVKNVSRTQDPTLGGLSGQANNGDNSAPLGVDPDHGGATKVVEENWPGGGNRSQSAPSRQPTGQTRR
jgi:hypothetical protein